MPQALRGQYVLHFGGANAKRERAECTMRRGMRIAADHGHARQSQAGFRADDVHNALPNIAHLEFGNAVFRAIGVQRLDLQARDRIGNAMRTVSSGYVVIRHCNRCIDTAGQAPSQLEALECLRAGHFVHQMAVDIQQRGAVGLNVDYVRVPQFLK